MEGQAMLGRGIAAVGVVLGLIAIWTDYASQSSFGQTVTAAYWDDGTFGGLLLILAILAAFALAGAVATGRREFDLAVGAIGGIGLGLYLFIPAAFAFDQWDLLDAGAWLGLCSALTFVGAQIATWASDRPLARPSGPATLLALVGLALIIAGLFPEFETDQGSYWNIHGLGHSFGILMIILVVLDVLSIAAAYTLAAGMDSAIMVGAVTLGAAIAVPVGNAFNNFGELGTGAWLTGVGGIVLGVGVAAMRQMAQAEVPAAAPATPPPTPPAV